MQTVRVNDIDLDVETVGEGEPVLLVHGAIFCDTFAPLLQEATLGDYRLIRCRRRGYGGRGPTGTMTVEQHALDALALLEHLDATPAHVVGHSYGSLVALQLAVDAPEAVRTVTLLEAGLASLLPSAAAIGEALAPIGAAYGAGDFERAVDMVSQAVFGPDYRLVVDKNLPDGAFDLAVADAVATFEGDIGMMGGWNLDEGQRRSITQPVLSVIGGESDEVMKQQFGVSLMPEVSALVRAWLPQTDEVVLPGLNHALLAQDAGAVAGALATFLARHRIE